MNQTRVEWESVETSPGPALQRARVPGGWLVVCFDMEMVRLESDSGGPHYTGDMPYGAMTFVPDPEHQWMA